MIHTRAEFRVWLEENHDKMSECWLALKRGKPVDDLHFWYLDAVEEALCFGWIDSTQRIVDGVPLQRFSPRKKNSPWSELNKGRVRQLERLGLMTDAGRMVLPDMDTEHFRVHPEIQEALEQSGAWETFLSFLPLYQRIRAYNVEFYLKRNREQYKKALAHLITETQKGHMYGEWNDYGRLLE